MKNKKKLKKQFQKKPNMKKAQTTNPATFKNNVTVYNSKPVEPKKPELKIKASPELLLSTRIQKQIATAHKECGSVEWSGYLFYSVNGSIENPEKMSLKAEAFYLMDIGTSGYTEYESDPELICDMMEIYPEYANGNWKMGHIHTHHSMNAYFSGTDQEELHDNAPAHNYYLSLIVNFAMNPVARIAILLKSKVRTLIEKEYTFKNEEGVETVNNLNQDDTIEKEMLGIIDCDIVFEEEENNDSDFLRILSERTKQKEEEDKEAKRLEVIKKASVHTPGFYTEKQAKAYAGIGGYMARYNESDRANLIFQYRKSKTEFYPYSINNDVILQCITDEELESDLSILLSRNKEELGLNFLVLMNRRENDSMGEKKEMIESLPSVLYDTLDEIYGELDVKTMREIVNNYVNYLKKGATSKTLFGHNLVFSLESASLNLESAEREINKANEKMIN